MEMVGLLKSFAAIGLVSCLSMSVRGVLAQSKRVGSTNAERKHHAAPTEADMFTFGLERGRWSIRGAVRWDDELDQDYPSRLLRLADPPAPPAIALRREPRGPEIARYVDRQPRAAQHHLPDLFWSGLKLAYIKHALAARPLPAKWEGPMSGLVGYLQAHLGRFPDMADPHVLAAQLHPYWKGSDAVAEGKILAEPTLSRTILAADPRFQNRLAFWDPVLSSNGSRSVLLVGGFATEVGNREWARFNAKVKRKKR